MGAFPEYIDGLPNISGSEADVEKIVAGGADQQLYVGKNTVDFSRINSCFSIALHMHQPLIPAGGGDLQTADVISNLEDMYRNPGIGDNHNADVFRWCYKRIGEFVPELVNEGKQPRVMLEYSGTLLHGLFEHGMHDVLDALKTVTMDSQYYHCVEWLGCPWGHAVAPSTPVQDFRLHVRAWQQFFGALFGAEALARVRGFSPSEMALPNHPDVAYEFLKTLKDCGFKWLIVQEHTVERPENGYGPEHPHLPHLLVCQNSKGETVSMVCVIKTQGSDTKLVAQMQPYYEATGLGRQNIGKVSLPPIVSQIADGENGGVMMNEFPDKFLEVMRAASNSDTVPVTVTEYLEHMFASGVKETDLPVLQPIKQRAIWENFKPGDGPEKLDKIIEKLKNEDHQFHMDGGSWTNNISWVQGYENVIGPMEKASSLFNEKVIKPGVNPAEHRYRNALFYLLCSQTSCYRYWGQGMWTDYGRELCRRVEAIVSNDF